MPNGSPRYHIGAKWWIVSAISAFFRALRVPATTKGGLIWSDTAPTTVWNFDHDQPRQHN